MLSKNVKLIKPGKTYVGLQGVLYNAGVSRNTAGSEKVCMNILPMPPGVHSSGDDQDELISMPDLVKELDKFK